MAARKEPDCLYLVTTGRRTGQPREIEIWFTRRGGRYYLVAEHGEHADWVLNIQANPRVRFRVRRRTWRARARIVRDSVEPKLCAHVRRLSERKYGWGDGLVVELLPGARVQ